MQYANLMLAIASYCLAIGTIFQDDWPDLTKARVVAGGLALTGFGIFTM